MRGLKFSESKIVARLKEAETEHSAVPNRLKRDFSPERPNQVWCGDITYIWTGERWAYLAVVRDLFARKPVGRALSTKADANLVCQALIFTFESRGKPANVMFHADQGV